MLDDFIRNWIPIHLAAYVRKGFRDERHLVAIELVCFIYRIQKEIDVLGGLPPMNVDYIPASDFCYLPIESPGLDTAQIVENPTRNKGRGSMMCDGFCAVAWVSGTRVWEHALLLRAKADAQGYQLRSRDWEPLQQEIAAREYIHESTDGDI